MIRFSCACLPGYYDTNIPPLHIHIQTGGRVQWASYQIRKTVGCASTGNAANVFPATDLKGNRQFAIPACITQRT